MKSFLRENPTIAFGLGLPLLLVVMFLLLSGIPSLIVPPPQYDVLYTTGHRHYEHDVQISVVEEKVLVTYHNNNRNNSYNNNKLRLWRYMPQTGAVKEIAIILPASNAPADDSSTVDVQSQTDQSQKSQASKASTIEIPELASLTIDSSSIAPDGYEFNADLGRYSGNVFGGLFYSRRYSYDAQLSKSGRNVRLPNTVDRYYGRAAKLVGWVVAE